MKTSELSGAALDWAVALCEGSYAPTVDTDIDGTQRVNYGGMYPEWSNDWSRGGPIIEREEIELHKWALDGWEARATNYSFLNTPNERPEFARQHGPTPLIAAMRCFVASRLGDEVQVPEGLK
jgi:hypothetical protein